jgi:putative hydrolase of the HAD superfamily
LIKAVAFDFGNTLVSSGLPLNWQEFYREVLTEILGKVDVKVDPDKIEAGERVLIKYNTRINYREYEVPADVIFTELLQEWGVRDLTRLSVAKDMFFSFFLKRTETFPDTEPVLKELRNRDMKIGVLSDTAYGAYKEYLAASILEINQYIDCFLTSTDIGFRKPNTLGYFRLAKELKIAPADCLFVGDEEKDISGANAAGMISVLIDRNNQHHNWGQIHTINSLKDVSNLV